MVNHYFLDTSALAKRYIPEIGTPWINRITFQTHWNTDYHIITVDQTLLNLATELIKKHPLRAYDAVQLASALIIQPDLPDPATNPFTFVSADDRLLAIAQLEGLTIFNPNRA